MNERKLIEETQETLPESSAQPTVAHAEGEARGLDQRRRRLIRGAIGIAPMVVTLRAGVVNAAIVSCVGTKSVTGTIVNGGKVTGVPTAANGDHCIVIHPDVTATNQCSSADHIVRITNSGGRYSDGGTVSINGSNVRCTGIDTVGTQVAIVSASVTSFI